MLKVIFRTDDSPIIAVVKYINGILTGILKENARKEETLTLLFKFKNGWRMGGEDGRGGKCMLL